MLLGIIAQPVAIVKRVSRQTAYPGKHADNGVFVLPRLQYMLFKIAAAHTIPAEQNFGLCATVQGKRSPVCNISGYVRKRPDLSLILA
jgi:hypothetical protein